jgi:hypothetical protein
MRCSPSLRDFAAPRTLAFGAFVTLAAGMLMAAPATAADCGDDVDGERVACACGDNVVSDTTLKPGDPVISDPCSGDALVLFPPRESNGITLNLGGHALVGKGYGAGIRVLRGGKLGSSIVGGGERPGARAEIVKFGTGIRASGRNLLREVRDLTVRDNRYDGLQLRTNGVVVTGVDSRSNGRDGVVVSGHGNEVSGVVSSGNLRDGLQVRGTGSQVRAETSGNRRNGTVVGGRGNELVGVESNGNGRLGVLANGADHALGDVESSGNAAADVTGRPGAIQ